MRKKIDKFKADNKNVDFGTKFCQGNTSVKFDISKSVEASFKGNLYDFPVYYNSNNKSDILTIYKYLMVKYNIK